MRGREDRSKGILNLGFSVSKISQVVSKSDMKYFKMGIWAICFRLAAYLPESSFVRKALRACPILKHGVLELGNATWRRKSLASNRNLA